MTSSTPAIAVIDGKLCRLARSGAIAATHAPLATAVLEFRLGPMSVFVREHSHGLLPGMPNVYCLDADFRLQWLATWPFTEDPAAKLLGDTDTTLIVESTQGIIVHLDATDGSVQRIAHAMAATG